MNIKRTIIAAAIAAAAISPTGAADARANNCSVIYGNNFAQATCRSGNRGDFYNISITCERTAWWSNQRVTATGNYARVGYGDGDYSHAQCQTGFRRIGGGTIHTP